MRLLFCVGLFAATLSGAPGIHNLELVGQLALGPGFNADVWGHGNYAYVGTWGSATRCPSAGVKVIDISEPAVPRLVGQLGGHANTTAEDVVVRHVENSFFKGDLLAVGLQACSTSQPAQRGAEFFDVTDPRHPQPLSFFDTGTESRGVHELDLSVRADGRVFALLATISRFRLVEVTDPNNPKQLSDWNISERLDEAPSSSRFCHSALASSDGRLAFLSYWDGGVVILDISEPSNPRFLGRTGFGPDEEGNAHSVSVSPDNKLMLTADEDFDFGNRISGFNHWGFLRVFDISDHGSPRQLSTFLTANAHTDRVNGPPDNGTYSIHNPFLVGDLGFLSWYSDGIRVVDLANRQQPLEVGYFVPPDNPDPFGALANKAQIWGVFVQPEKALVLASDINFGLYLLRALESKPFPGGVVDAASFAKNGPLAPGSIATIFGTDLTGATATASSLPLPSQLSGARVKVNGTPAPLFYVSPGQINFLIPPQTSLGTARISVENLGRASRETTADVVAAAPGVFTLSQDARGPAAALHASDQSPVNNTHPARAGEVVQIYASGLGSGNPVSATIGARPAEVQFAGLAPGFPGLYQINILVPAGMTGMAELAISAGGRSSNTALLPLQ